MNSVLPLIWIIASALVYWLTGYLFSDFVFYTSLLAILEVVILFGFGITLSYHKRNNRTWVRKLVIALVVVLILFTRINVISAGGINAVFNQFKITTLFINLILVYCGWSFFL